MSTHNICFHEKSALFGALYDIRALYMCCTSNVVFYCFFFILRNYHFIEHSSESSCKSCETVTF